MPQHMPISILLCEDDESALQTLQRVVARLRPDSTIYSATNGKSGLECFERHLPDILITDIRMPVMDGIEMARRMKEVKPELKTIVITASSEKSAEDFRAKSPVEIDHFCWKPLAFNRLASAINDCVIRIATERGNG
ncbi:response regulator transcription factor [Geomesophilobacter sediminis]|uniref:Response regulator n=1 Tax=Geomesophilobacter sediminis TaxID=2798584 RepID=A0A8J7J5B1_9BACT|nr:response regulator [Geomesophilobacter sediminis]MBJ6723581.1 response regulator [Geomesophilobacter sediminis]